MLQALQEMVILPAQRADLFQVHASSISHARSCSPTDLFLIGNTPHLAIRLSQNWRAERCRGAQAQ